VRHRAHRFRAGRVPVAFVEGPHATDVGEQDRERGGRLPQVGELLVEHPHVEQAGDRILGDGALQRPVALPLEVGAGGPDQREAGEHGGADQQARYLHASDAEDQVDHGVPDRGHQRHGERGP
jgi:hypothetical protein